MFDPVLVCAGRAAVGCCVDACSWFIPVLRGISALLVLLVSPSGAAHKPFFASPQVPSFCSLVAFLQPCLECTLVLHGPSLCVLLPMLCSCLTDVIDFVHNRGSRHNSCHQLFFQTAHDAACEQFRLALFQESRSAVTSVLPRHLAQRSDTTILRSTTQKDQQTR